MKTIIYNADIANEGRLTRGYIVIDDEIIAEVGEGEPAAAVMAECDVRNDVDGALVMHIKPTSQPSRRRRWLAA